MTATLVDAVPLTGAADALRSLVDRVDGLRDEPAVAGALSSGVSRVLCGRRRGGKHDTCGGPAATARRRRDPPQTHPTFLPLTVFHQTDDAALTILTTLAVRPTISPAVAGAARGAALALAAALAARPPPSAGGADVAVALSWLADVAPHTRR